MQTAAAIAAAVNTANPVVSGLTCSKQGKIKYIQKSLTEILKGRPKSR
jgi:hypothetical protein